MATARKLHLFEITWPIFVENLLMVLMGLFGLWLTSRISTGAVAAYGLVNHPASLRGYMAELFGREKTWGTK